MKGQQAPLTLGQVLDGVRAYHPKIEGATAEIEAARGKVREKRGAFDPVLSFSSDSIRYNPSSARGKEYTTFMTETSVEVLTRDGIKFFLTHQLSAGQVKSPATSTGNLGNVVAGAKIPILRDNRVNQKTIEEKQARVGEPIAEANRLLAKVDTLRAASLSYWEWLGAGERLKIQNQLLEIASTRYEQIRKIAAQGLRPKIDVTEALSQLDSRQTSRTKAERDLQKAAFKLNEYLWNPDGTAKDAPTSDSLVQLEIPSEPESGGLDALITTAYERRPELQALNLARQVVQYDLALAQNARRPDLDLVVGPGQDFGAGGIGTTWKAGIFFSFPLYWNAAEGSQANFRAKLAKLNQEEKLLKLRIKNEVQDAKNALLLAHQRYRQGVEMVQSLKKVEDGERIKFDQGISTLFLLNQRETATAEAAARVVDFLVEYYQAQAALSAATMDLETKN